MYYYIKDANEIKKYLVNYDFKEIEKLKLEVIDNCSVIIHYDYEDTRGPDEADYLKIRNYKAKKTGIRVSRDYFPDEAIYHFSYDEYKYPYLITLIDKLLNKDVSIINEIYHPNSEEIVSYREKLNIASKELDEINNFDIQNKKQKLNEIEKLLQQVKLNEKQQPVDSYYLKLQNLIKLQLVDVINIDDILGVTSFFEQDLSVFNLKIDDDLIKKRKKID